MLKKLFYSSREDRNHISKIGVVTNLFLCLFGSLKAQVSKKITNLFGNSKDVGTSRLRIVSLLTMLLLSPFAKSQLITEDFNYTASSALVVTNGYTANTGTGTNNLTVAASGTGLSYAGSPRSGVGLSLPLANTGEDAYKAFTSQTTGSVYASALINLSAVNTTGDYFFCLMTGATYNIRLFAKSSGTGYVLGISKSGATTVYDATVRSFNTTYIVVLKYEFITGTLNDPISLYVNPTLGGTEPSPLLTSIGAPTADAASISSYGFRQGSAANAPTLVIDGIMVGTTWAQVTPLAAASPAISQPTAITGLNYTGAGPSTWTPFIFTGSNLSPASGNITVTGTTNFEVSSDGITAAAGNSYTVAYTGGALSSTTAYVRLKSGLSAATYGPITGVTLSGGGATTINVSTTGTATSASTALVSLSSSTTASEQSGTVVTITATTNNVVLTDQTVDVVVTGTGITGTDYSITDGDAAAGIQIKILAGNTTGTITFTILNDNINEGTETATLTISNPTSGMSLGSPTAVNIAITDNDDAIYLNALNVIEPTVTFDDLALSGTNSLNIKGCYLLETGGSANLTYNADNGSLATGNTYSYGTSASTDRALGSLASGGVGPTHFGLKLTNNTGGSINAIDITYTGEQWRNGGNLSTDVLYFEYSTDATSLNTGTWNNINDLKMISLINTATASALNGNLPANQTTLNKIVGLGSISNGTSVWIRWRDENIGGNDHGMGVDNLILKPMFISPSVFYSKPTGNLELLGTWGDNTDGSGNAPTNFTNAGQVFYIANHSATAATIGSNWNVSGATSKVSLGNGLDINSFVVPSGLTFTSTLFDVRSNNTFTNESSSTSPVFGIIDPTSTVTYGAISGTQNVDATTYGNLNFIGAGAKNITGALTVQNDLTLDGTTLTKSTVGFVNLTYGGNITILSPCTYTSGFTTNVNFTTTGNANQVVKGNGNSLGCSQFNCLTKTSGSLTLSTVGGFTTINTQDDIKMNMPIGTSFIDGGNTLNVGGDFETDGIASSYNLTGTLSMNGFPAAAVNIRLNATGGSAIPGVAELNNVIINSSTSNQVNFQPIGVGTGSTTIKGDLTISGTSTYSGGIRFGNAPATGVTLKGNYTNTLGGSVIFSTSGTLIFGGTSAQTYSTAFLGGDSFFNVVLNNSNGLTLGSDIRTNGSLICTSGILTTGSNKVILGSTSTISESSTSNVLGFVQTTRTLTNTLQTFGGLGVEITALGSAPGSTIVIRETGTSSNIGCTSSSLLRNFSITPTVNSGLNANITYTYFDNELNSITESGLALYTGSSPWTSISTSVNTTTNSISAIGINSIGTLTAAYAATPLLNTNSTLINASNPTRLLAVTSLLPNTNYVWSPATDIYTDASLTTPYIAGTNEDTVYAAPFSTITYNVTAINTLISCTSSPASVLVNVDPAITNDICASNSPAGLVTVTSTPTFIMRSLTGATASPGASCVAINKDIWFSAVVPSNGEIHVTTQEHNNPTASLNITSALVQIFTATTCSTGLSQVACNSGGATANMAYASATGLIPGTTVYIRLARTTANNSPAAQFIRMAVTKGLIWTGTTNSDFTNPGNYLGGDATSLTGPSTNSTVIIPVVSSNTYPIVTGTQTCHGLEFVSTYSNQNPNITISAGSELRLQASSTYKSFINRSGFASSPKIEGTGTLRFNEGGVNSGEVLCPVRFYGVVAVRSGVNVISNGNMRFENNSVLLCGGVATSVPTKNYSGTVSGNIVYVRTGTVYAGYNYWSSPIGSANTDLLLSNYGNNIYEYNNQNPGSVTNTLLGWSAITSGTTSIPGSGVTMTPGKGYIQTFAGNGSVTFTGTPNQTSVSIPTTVNGTNNFNLLGNPYPAALSYDAFKASNPSLGSVYLWSNVGATIPYNVSSYVVMSSLGLAGNSVSGFTAKEIGPTQGFLTNVSSAGNINFSPNHVVPNYPGNTTQFLEGNPLSLIRLRLTNPNQLNYDILVGFGDEGTEGVDFGYDSPRMPSSEDLELYSLIGEQQYTTQLLPSLTNTRIVDLGAVMSATGTHTFDLTGFDNFDSSVRVYLEDVLTGEFHNMNASSSYSFTNDPSFTNTRFRLHFMAPIVVSVTGTCLEQSNGKMIINNPNDQNPITTTLRNDQGVVIGSSSPFVGEYVFQNLPSGSYGVDLELNQNDVVTQYVNVDGGGIITPATFVSSATEVSIVDAIIEFSAQAQGASEFTWNFGDGVTLSGTATPVHAYTQPGIYTVTLTASNGICESIVSSIITVTNNPTSITDVSGVNGFSVYPNPANDQLNIFKSNNDKVLFEMNDVSGKCVLRSQLNSKLNNINVSNLDSGVYSGSLIQNGIRKTIRVVIIH